MTFEALKLWIKDYLANRQLTYGPSDFIKINSFELICSIYDIFKVHFAEEGFADRLKGWDETMVIYSVSATGSQSKSLRWSAIAMAGFWMEPAFRTRRGRSTFWTRSMS